MFGRGSCDTKAGMAGMMMALRHVSQSDELPINVWVTTTIDEEYSFQGIRHLAAQEASRRWRRRRAHSIDTIIAHKGCIRWESRPTAVLLTAKPQLGINAVSK
jgi:acetylornithine deacetylase